MIERGEGFLISRNLGRAAEIARANDPRQVRSLPNRLTALTGEPRRAAIDFRTQSAGSDLSAAASP